MLDLRDSGPASPEARRALVGWAKTRANTVALAVISGSTMARTTLTLIFSAMRVLSQQIPRLGFFATEAEARDWLARQRPRLRSHAQHQGSRFCYPVAVLEHSNMDDRERTEKVRQQIMRLNELLGIMRSKLGEGERAYSALFAAFEVEETAAMKHKDLQWKLAEQMDNLSPLKEAVSSMRFSARQLEKAFEELYGIIAATSDA